MQEYLPISKHYQHFQKHKNDDSSTCETCTNLQDPIRINSGILTLCFCCLELFVFLTVVGEYAKLLW